MLSFSKTVLRALSGALEPQAFRRKGNRFRRDGLCAIQWIELQKSRDSTDSRYEFTINLGSFLPGLARALGEDIREIDILNGHWNVRLGELLPSHKDRWWAISSQSEAVAVGEEVAALTTLYGLPELKKAGSASGLLTFFETGKGIPYAGSRRDEVLAGLKRLVESESETERAG